MLFMLIFLLYFFGKVLDAFSSFPFPHPPTFPPHLFAIRPFKAQKYIPIGEYNQMKDYFLKDISDIIIKHHFQIIIYRKNDLILQKTNSSTDSSCFSISNNNLIDTINRFILKNVGFLKFKSRNSDSKFHSNSNSKSENENELVDCSLNNNESISFTTFEDQWSVTFGSAIMLSMFGFESLNDILNLRKFLFIPNSIFFIYRNNASITKIQYYLDASSSDILNMMKNFNSLLLVVFMGSQADVYLAEFEKGSNYMPKISNCQMENIKVTDEMEFDKLLQRNLIQFNWITIQKYADKNDPVNNLVLLKITFKEPENSNILISIFKRLFLKLSVSIDLTVLYYPNGSSFVILRNNIFGVAIKRFIMKELKGKDVQITWIRKKSISISDLEQHEPIFNLIVSNSCDENEYKDKNSNEYKDKGKDFIKYELSKSLSFKSFPFQTNYWTNLKSILSGGIVKSLIFYWEHGGTREKFNNQNKLGFIKGENIRETYFESVSCRSDFNILEKGILETSTLCKIFQENQENFNAIKIEFDTINNQIHQTCLKYSKFSSRNSIQINVQGENSNAKFRVTIFSNRDGHVLLNSLYSDPDSIALLMNLMDNDKFSMFLYEERENLTSLIDFSSPIEKYFQVKISFERNFKTHVSLISALLFLVNFNSDLVKGFIHTLNETNIIVSKYTKDLDIQIKSLFSLKMQDSLRISKVLIPMTSIWFISFSRQGNLYHLDNYKLLNEIIDKNQCDIILNSSDCIIHIFKPAYKYMKFQYSQSLRMENYKNLVNLISQEIINFNKLEMFKLVNLLIKIEDEKLIIEWAMMTREKDLGMEFFEFINEKLGNPTFFSLLRLINPFPTGIEPIKMKIRRIMANFIKEKQFKRTRMASVMSSLKDLEFNFKKMEYSKMEIQSLRNAPFDGSINIQCDRFGEFQFDSTVFNYLRLIRLGCFSGGRIDSLSLNDDLILYPFQFIQISERFEYEEYILKSNQNKLMIETNVPSNIKDMDILVQFIMDKALTHCVHSK